MYDFQYIFIWHGISNSFGSQLPISCTYQPINCSWIQHYALWRPLLELPAVHPERIRLLSLKRISFGEWLHQWAIHESYMQCTTSSPDCIWDFPSGGKQTASRTKNKQTKLLNFMSMQRFCLLNGCRINLRLAWVFHFLFVADRLYYCTIEILSLFQTKRHSYGIVMDLKKFYSKLIHWVQSSLLFHEKSTTFFEN